MSSSANNNIDNIDNGSSSPETGNEQIVTSNGGEAAQSSSTEMSCPAQKQSGKDGVPLSAKADDGQESNTNPVSPSNKSPKQAEQQQQQQQQQPYQLNHPEAVPQPAVPSLEPILSIAQRLLSLRGSPPGTLASMSDAEIRLLCQRVRPILLNQPMLLELEAPIKICGDIHGQFTDLLRLFEYGGFPPESNYLFLGDYVDRGKQSLETICLLLCYKICHPENFFILRGNHESAGINRIYGFYDECKRRYSIRLWKVFSDVFNCLPISALVDEKILCMHGGLSPEMEALQQIADLARPCDVPDVGLMCDLLWSDPDGSISVSSITLYSFYEIIQFHPLLFHYTKRNEKQRCVSIKIE